MPEAGKWSDVSGLISGPEKRQHHFRGLPEAENTMHEAPVANWAIENGHVQPAKATFEKEDVSEPSQ